LGNWVEEGREAARVEPARRLVRQSEALWRKSRPFIARDKTAEPAHGAAGTTHVTKCRPAAVVPRASPAVAKREMVGACGGGSGGVEVGEEQVKVSRHTILEPPPPLSEKPLPKRVTTARAWLALSVDGRMSWMAGGT
jgi:hypothetical protein